jgi:hypothetical protein
MYRVLCGVTSLALGVSILQIRARAANTRLRNASPQAWPLASAYCRSELAPRTLGCATHHHGVCSSACAASARALWPLLAFAGYRWLGASEVAEDPTARRAFADAQGPPTHTSYLRACVLVALSSTADASRMPHKHDSADTAASDVTGAALRLGFPCVFRASFGLR